MALADYLVAAVLIEGRPVADVAREHGVSRSWLYELLARYREHGDDGLRPRSRRPRRSPTRTSTALEDEMVRWRKRLTDQGLDAGAATIHTHLTRAGGPTPSPATIWRILARRGFMAPQPAKRPGSSYTRFEAALPNERWQTDITHWRLANGRTVEIMNIIDDHSRLLVASVTATVFDAAAVLQTFKKATRSHGEPASLLTDIHSVSASEMRVLASWRDEDRGGRRPSVVTADRSKPWDFLPVDRDSGRGARRRSGWPC